MSRNRELAKNAAILAFGKFATQFIAILLLPIYARFLDPVEFGVFDLVMTYMTLALPFLTIRLEYAAFRFLIDARKNESEKVRIVSTMSRFLTFILVGWVAVYLTISYFIDIPYGYFALALALAMTVSGVVLQVSRGFGSNKGFAIASMIAGMITSVGSLLTIVVAGWGIEGIFISAIVGNILASIYLALNLHLQNYVKLSQYDKKLNGELLRFGAPMVPSGLAWWVINGADRTIIAIFLGLASNGVYAIASRYSFVLVSVATVFGMAWKESASMYIDSKDRDKYFSQTINTSLKMFGCIGLLLIAVTPLIFTTVFGSRYEEAMMYIPILVIASFFCAVVELYAGIYVAKKLSGKLATTNIIAALISILLNLALIQSIGLYAAAIAMFVAFGSMAIWRAFDVRRYVAITYDRRAMGVLLGACLIVCAVYYVGGLIFHLGGLALAMAVSYWLNRRELGRIRAMVLGRIGK